MPDFAIIGDDCTRGGKRRGFQMIVEFFPAKTCYKLLEHERKNRRSDFLFIFYFKRRIKNRVSRGEGVSKFE